MAPTVEHEVIVQPGARATLEVRLRPLGVVLGNVESTSDGAWLKGVRAELVPAGTGQTRTAATGDDGAYRFPDVPKGTYEVRLQVPRGFVCEGESTRSIEVAAGSRVRADFRLVRHGSVEGQVLTEEGTPVPGAEVALVGPGGRVVGVARTDAEGRYSFAQVPVDKYTVRVTSDD